MGFQFAVGICICVLYMFRSTTDARYEDEHQWDALHVRSSAA